MTDGPPCDCLQCRALREAEAERGAALDLGYSEAEASRWARDTYREIADGGASGHSWATGPEVAP
jgi:hypothetical protein